MLEVAQVRMKGNISTEGIGAYRFLVMNQHISPIYIRMRPQALSIGSAQCCKDIVL